MPFQLDYLIGNVTGIVGSDTVTVGDFQVTSQVFGGFHESGSVANVTRASKSSYSSAMANETDGLGLSATGNSGILGLAFPAEAAIPETTGRTLAENLFSGLSDDADRYFAFRLGRDDSDSSFTIGELDPTYANSTGDLTLHPVLPTQGAIYDYWKLPFQSLTINGTAFELSKSRIEGASTPIAVLDSGTTLMLGPSGDVARFWESVGGARETNRGWEVPCNRAVAVGLVLGDGNKREEYAVDPADISWTEGSVQSTSWCLGGVQANDGVRTVPTFPSTYVALDSFCSFCWRLTPCVPTLTPPSRPPLQVYSADWLLGDTFLRVRLSRRAVSGLQGYKTSDGRDADLTVAWPFQNVYVTHHAAAGSQPPAIGLRSLTDPAAALAAFVESRGPDALPPARVLSHPPSSHSLTSGGICGIATACGFIAGAVFAALALFYTPRRKKY